MAGGGGGLLLKVLLDFVPLALEYLHTCHEVSWRGDPSLNTELFQSHICLVELEDRFIQYFNFVHDTEFFMISFVCPINIFPLLPCQHKRTTLGLDVRF